MITLERHSNEKDIYTHFRDIFLKYYSPLCLYALRYVKDTNIAEDIVQDVFTAVWQKREEIDFDLPIKPLLYKYTHNKTLDYLKSSNFNTERLDEYVGYTALDNYVRDLVANQIEDDLNVKELNEEIQQCIENLPDQCKKVYRLSRIDNLKNKEIAEKLDISIKTVEKHISKALCEMREHLNKKGLLPVLALAILLLRLNK